MAITDRQKEWHNLLSNGHAPFECPTMRRADCSAWGQVRVGHARTDPRSARRLRGWRMSVWKAR